MHKLFFLYSKRIIERIRLNEGVEKLNIWFLLNNFGPVLVSCLAQVAKVNNLNEFFLSNFLINSIVRYLVRKMLRSSFAFLLT